MKTKNKREKQTLPENPERELLYFGGVLLLVQFAIATTISTAQGPLLNLIVASFVLLAWLCGLFARLVHPPKTILFSKVDILVSFFAALILVSFAFYTPRLDSFRTGLPWLAFLLGFFLTKTLIRELKWKSLLLHLGLAGALLASLDAIYQYYVGLDLARDWIMDPKNQDYLKERFTENEQKAFLGRLNTQRAFGNFLLPNFLASYLGIWIPILIGFMWDNRQKKARQAFFSVILLLLVVALILTKSRGGILSIGIVCGFWVVYYSPIARCWLQMLYWISALLASLFFTVVHQGYLILPSSLIFIENGVQSFGVRLSYWETSFRMFLKYPFGVGLHNFSEFYFQLKPPYAGETKFAHNNFFQLANELTLLGALVFVLIFWFGLRKTTKTQFDSKRISYTKGQRILGFFVLGSAFFLSIFLKGEFFFDTTLPQKTLLLQTLFQVFTLALLLFFFYQLTFLEVHGKGVQLGLRLGVLVFLVHSFVDFDLYVFSLFQLAFLLVALLDFEQPHQEISYGLFIRTSQFLLALLLVALYFGAGILSELNRESNTNTAQSVYARLVEDYQKLQKEKPLSLPELFGIAEHGHKAIQKALKVRPLDWKLYLIAAKLFETEAKIFALLASKYSTKEAQSQEMRKNFFLKMQLALSNLEKACHNGENSAQPFIATAQLHHEFAQKKFATDSKKYQDYLKEKVIPYLEKAIVLYPTRPRSLLELGKIYFEAKEYQKAQKTFENAQKMSKQAFNIEERFSKVEKNYLQEIFGEIKKCLGKTK